MNFNDFSRDDWILGGLALLLIIDLLFLPSFSLAPGFSLNATGSLDGWTAVISVVACVAVIADLGIERLSPGTTLPNIGGSRTQTRFVLACIAAGFLVLKFVLHIHFSYFGFGFWAGIVLAAGLVYVALQARSGRAIGAR